MKGLWLERGESRHQPRPEYGRRNSKALRHFAKNNTRICDRSNADRRLFKTTKRDSLSTKLLLLDRADVLPKESPASARAYAQAYPARQQTISFQQMQPRQQGPMHHKRQIVDDGECGQNECKAEDAPHEVFIHARCVCCPGYHIADPTFRLLVQRVRRRALAEEEMRLALGEVEDRLREDGVCPGEPGSYSNINQRRQ